MTVSVCMATYQGEKFIEKQLQSIWRQTRKPDEVIICDDGSADGTVQKILNFIHENKLDPNWKLYRNETNLGYPGNFYHAMGIASGEIVFLSDQDDLWHERKIERMLEILEQNPQIKAVSCKFDLINETGEKIHTVMSPTKSGESAELKDITPRDIFRKYEWPGMVLAYRNDWYHTWENERSKVAHDFQICMRASQEKGFVQMDECLAWHRRHENNTGSEEHRFAKLLNQDRKLWEIEKYLDLLKNLSEEKVLYTEEGKKVLQEKKMAMQDRYEALQSGKIRKILKNAWRHRREERLVTVVCDALIAVIGK